MDSYKYSVGQRVSFTKPRLGQGARIGTIVKRWWYDSQGFVGYPMYDIDYGDPEVALGVDEDCITPVVIASSKLGTQGQIQLRKALADKRAFLKDTLRTARETRKEIKNIREALKAGVK